MKKLIIASTLILLAACSTTQVPLTYTPNAAASAHGKPLAVVDEVKDSRKYTGTALGSVRNGFGVRALELELQKPASEVVRDAVNDGMKSRGMLAAGASKYVININIIKLDCNKYAHREAHAQFDITMVDKASNQAVYTKTVTANKVDGSMWEVSFSQTDRLRAVANEALQEAVDQLLNDPAFTVKFN